MGKVVIDMARKVLPACILFVAPAMCFITGNTPGAPILLPTRLTTAMVAKVAPGKQRPVSWPDEHPTPSLDQPLTARIVAVAPADIDSPFEYKGKHPGWFEVRSN